MENVNALIPNLKGYSLLFAEDDIYYSKVVKILLADTQIKVYAVNTGAKAN